MKYPYAVLGVGENAPQEEIRQAYLEKLKKFPPEKNQAKFQEVADAWHLVENELARAKLKIFGIPQEVTHDLKMSDLISADTGDLRRPGMEFWLKLLEQEPDND
jgi:curved DNA-binding protein CbpA